MSELVEWLTKVLDEDEDLARDAHYDGQAWLPEEESVLSFPVDDVVYIADRKADARHIAHHSPAAVLADIAAKRAIIAECVARDTDVDLMLGPDCLRQREWSGLRLAVQLMATAYTDRPGYRDEWKPLSSRTHP